jgi:hypothetical protein
MYLYGFITLFDMFSSCAVFVKLSELKGSVVMIRQGCQNITINNFNSNIKLINRLSLQGIYFLINHRVLASGSERYALERGMDDLFLKRVLFEWLRDR